MNSRRLPRDSYITRRILAPKFFSLVEGTLATRVNFTPKNFKNAYNGNRLTKELKFSYWGTCVLRRAHRNPLEPISFVIHVTRLKAITKNFRTVLLCFFFSKVVFSCEQTAATEHIMFVNVSQRLYSTEPKRLKTTSQLVTLQSRKLLCYFNSHNGLIILKLYKPCHQVNSSARRI